MATHSSVGASSMHRWAACPGSVKLSEGIESVSSEYALEGTTAHDLAAQILNGNKVTFPSKEMEENVTMYTDWVLNQTKFSDAHFIEHKFSLKEIHPKAFGTADCVMYFRNEKRLSVVDFKYGAGVSVEVDNNEQLMYYALGALLSLDLKVEKIELVIVQPRAYHEAGVIRKYEFNSLDIIDFADRLKNAIEETEKPNAPLKSGDHCRWCPAAAICPELHKNATELAKLEFEPVETYDSSKLKKALDLIPMVKAWVEAVHEYAYNEAVAGRPPEGYKLVEKRATRKWKDEQTIIKTAMDLKLGTDICYEEPKLKSVAQLEKAVGKKLFKDFFDANVTSESSGLTLVPIYDKRDSVDVGAKKDFTTITDVNLLT